MSLLHALYKFFIPTMRGKLKLLGVDIVLLGGTLILTVLIRANGYSSLELGADVFGGALTGFTVMVGFNSLVYIGSLAEPAS